MGIRRTLCARDVLEWDIEERQAPYGKIRVKRFVYGETVRVKPESDDVKAAARAHGVRYDTVYQAALRE